MKLLKTIIGLPATLAVMLGMLSVSVLGQSPKYGGINYASTSLTANTQLIAAPAAYSNGLVTVTPSIHILSYGIQVTQGGTAFTFGLTSGTGSACATNNALVTPAWLGVINTTQFITESFPAVIDLPAGKALCLTLSGAPTGAVVHLTYAIY